jgi:E3 ubiquitin ligase
MDWTSRSLTSQARWIGPALLAAFAILAWSRGAAGSGRGGGLEWVLDLAVAAGGAFFVRHGFGQLREKNMIENVPSSLIQSVALGLAEIKGSSPNEAPLAAPLSGAACHYYRFLVEEERRSGKDKHWVTLDEGKSNVPFHLQDSTGRILVNPQGADILLQRDYQRMERGEGWLGKRRRYQEWRIDPGDFVYVLGTVSRLQEVAGERRVLLAEKLRQLKKDPGAARRFDLDADGRLDEREWAGAVAVVKDDLLRQAPAPSAGKPEDTLVVGAGELESTFVISDRDERSITRALGWRALGAVAGGGAGMLVMSVSILGRLGLRPGGWTFPWEALFR